MDMETKRGGARKGAGRKPSAKPRNKTVTVRLTEKEQKQLRALGGPAWVRDQMVRAAQVQAWIAWPKNGAPDLYYSPAFERLSAGERYSMLEDALTIIKGRMSWIEPTIGDDE